MRETEHPGYLRAQDTSCVGNIEGMGMQDQFANVAGTQEYLRNAMGLDLSRLL